MYYYDVCVIILTLCPFLGQALLLLQLLGWVFLPVYIACGVSFPIVTPSSPAQLQH